MPQRVSTPGFVSGLALALPKKSIQNPENVPPRVRNGAVRPGPIAVLNCVLPKGVVVLLAAALLFCMGCSALKGQTKEKENVLRGQLHMFRAAIGQYTVDQQKPPQSLQDLIRSGYLKQIPTDPLTGRADTWVLDYSSNAKAAGIVNVRSGSNGISTEGSPYSNW